MADPLLELLRPGLAAAPSISGSRSRSVNQSKNVNASTSVTSPPTEASSKYLNRLLSLRLTDLTTTEPQSLSESSKSSLISIQSLSARSYRTTTISSDHLSTLSPSLLSLTQATKEIRESIPGLDEQAVNFATTYSRAPRFRDGDHAEDDTTAPTTTGNTLGGVEGRSGNAIANSILAARKEAQLLTRQADKLQDILDLPSLLSAAIASAASSTSTSTSAVAASASANYTQALDLFAYIKRLQNIYPDSQLIKSVTVEAEVAMKDMTVNLLNSLRSQNIRLAAAIRTIGWLRRTVPELSNAQHYLNVDSSKRTNQSAIVNNSIESTQTLTATNSAANNAAAVFQFEGSFGALFLTARLATFLSMTEALAPLRDLADQETEKRVTSDKDTSSAKTIKPGVSSSSSSSQSQGRRVSTQDGSAASSNTYTGGHQTERYLKRYLEIFREQSFATISTYRQIFPPPPPTKSSNTLNGQDQQDRVNGENTEEDQDDAEAPIILPQALSTFPLHLVDILMDTLRTYLPNLIDPASRESLLMQTLYAANSLGRLGADFSLMIAMLYEQHETTNQRAVAGSTNAAIRSDTVSEEPEMADTDEAEQAGMETKDDVAEVVPEPEWVRVIKKHRVQSARLDALAAG